MPFAFRYDTKGEIVVSGVPGRKLSWEEIGKRSAKVISFTDLAGHERYLVRHVLPCLQSDSDLSLLSGPPSSACSPVSPITAC